MSATSATMRDKRDKHNGEPRQLTAFLDKFLDNRPVPPLPVARRSATIPDN